MRFWPGQGTESGIRDELEITGEVGGLVGRLARFGENPQSSVIGQVGGPETPKLNLALHGIFITKIRTITISGDSPAPIRGRE